MSQVGRTRSMIFPPPPEPRGGIGTTGAGRETNNPRRETNPAGGETDRIRIFQEPEEDILLLGLMMSESNTISNLIRGLPHSRDDYRGNLRVIRGAAERVKLYATRLIGDQEES